MPFPSETLYPSESLYPSTTMQIVSLYDTLLPLSLLGRAKILLGYVVTGKSDIIIPDTLVSKSDILLHDEISSGVFDIILHDELVSRYDFHLLIPELESRYEIKELPWNKGDFVTLVSEMGDELKSSTIDFKGIFVRLKTTRSLPDSIDLPAGAGIVYVDPALMLNENDLITRKRRVYQLKSQELVKYIGANPIYRVLGLEEYMPSIELSSPYDIWGMDATKELEGLFDISEMIVAKELEGLFDISEMIVAKELEGLFDIERKLAQVAGLRASADVAAYNIDTYWNAIDDDDLDHFKIHRSTSDGFSPSDSNLVGLPTTNSFKHNDLAASTTYYFKAAAVTKAGIVGSYSSQASATTPV